MRELLKDCHRIESTAGSVYRLLAAEQSFDADLRGVFRQLAADEFEHARQIDLALQLPEQDLEGVSRVAGEKVDEALALAARMQERAGGGRLGEEEALRLAVALEESFVKFHLDNAVHFDNPRLTTLFENLGRSDEEHLNTLRGCLARWRTLRKNMGTVLE